jgi:hypothetical protein
MSLGEYPGEHLERDGTGFVRRRPGARRKPRGIGTAVQGNLMARSALWPVKAVSSAGSVFLH